MRNLTRWDEIAGETAGALVTKQSLVGTGASLVKLAIRAGARAERHSHGFEQFVQVVSGSGTLETSEGMQRFGAGSLFHFSKDTWHAAVFDEDTILVETNLRG